MSLESNNKFSNSVVMSTQRTNSSSKKTLSQDKKQESFKSFLAKQNEYDEQINALRKQTAKLIYEREEALEKNKKELNEKMNKKHLAVKRPRRGIKRNRLNQTGIPNSLKKIFFIEQNAFKYSLINYGSLNTPNSEAPLEYLNKMINYVKTLVSNKLEDFKGMRFNIALKCYFNNSLQPAKHDSWTFNCKNKLVYTKEIDNLLLTMKDDILKKIDEYLKRGSGWVFARNDGFWVNVSKYIPLVGGSYIDLPHEIKSTGCCINIKNKDNKCFRWCIAASQHPVKDHTDRTSNYKEAFDNIKDEGVDYPVMFKDYSKFEKQNNIKINVFRFDKILFPLYINDDPQNSINILSYQDHYVLIKNFNGLLYRITKSHSTKHFCMRCLHACSSAKILENHLKDCKSFEVCKTVLPTKDKSILEFKNLAKKLRVPFVIYADFECITKEINNEQTIVDKSVNGKVTKKESYTERYQEHIPCGCGYKIISIDPNYDPEPVVYRGENAHEKLLEGLLEEQKHLLKKLYNVETMIISAEQEEEFLKATNCHICNKELKEDRVRDHCHITGQYRGPAHNACNINYKDEKFIPVIFHNLKNYDSHFIIKIAGRYSDKVDCIPQNMEKYVSFTIDKLRFIDSFQFMPSSLETLAGNLKRSGIENFKQLSKYYSGEQLDLITEKGVYPYDYMNSFAKFNDTKLPKIKQFYSKLNESELKDSDYEHANKVWNSFNIKNMGEYHDLYLKSDILLLADVFESFRDVCNTAYGLDPCHYYTAPGLSWDAMFLKTGVKLELITDVEMYNFCEKDLRGGISVISHRYAKANNKYMESYDSSKPSSYITYLDCNNLYGDSMSQSLPCGGFKWLTKTELKKYNNDFTRILEITDDNEKGYIFEVDLEIPTKIHDKLNDYPIAESLRITEDMTSPYSKEVAKKHNIKADSVNKLVPNLINKTNYICHYRALKFYIELGCIVSKVHRVLQFKQSKWLEPYIKFNTVMRAKAKNDFEKDFFKLMNNSVYGKTMENVRNHIDAKLCTTEKQLKKKISNPRFKDRKIFDENMAIVEFHKKEVKLNKPIYVGFSVLELSKVKMMDFHYNYIQKKYGSKAKLCITDTDSLVYHIETEDVYEDFYKDKELFDFSDFSKDSKFHCDDNKKVVGVFKEENKGEPIIELVGQQSKCYSLLQENDCKNTAKGIKRCVKEKYLKHELYKSVLFDKKQVMNVQRTFKSDNHNVYSVETNKISLSSYDNKRYILDDGITTLAYGHKDANEFEQFNKKIIETNNKYEEIISDWNKLI